MGGNTAIPISQKETEMQRGEVSCPRSFCWGGGAHQAMLWDRPGSRTRAFSPRCRVGSGAVISPRQSVLLRSQSGLKS